MANSELINRARSADPQAIAALMNHSLQSKGIKASVDRSGDRLQIVLDSDTATNPSLLKAFVSNGLKNLNLTSIQSATVRGRMGDNIVWEETIPVASSGTESASSSQTASAASPTPAAPATPPPPPRPSPTPEATQPASESDAPAVTSVSPPARVTEADLETPRPSSSDEADAERSLAPVSIPTRDDSGQDFGSFGSFDTESDDLEEPNLPVPPGVNPIAPDDVLSSPEVLVEALPSVPEEMLKQQAQATEAIDSPRFVPNADSALDESTANTEVRERAGIADFGTEDNDDFVPSRDESAPDSELAPDSASPSESEESPPAESQESGSSRSPSRVLFALVLLLLAAVIGGLIGYAVWSYLTSTGPAIDEELPAQEQAPDPEQAPEEEPQEPLPTGEQLPEQEPGQESVQQAPTDSPEAVPDAGAETAPQTAPQTTPAPGPDTTQPAPQDTPQGSPQQVSPPATTGDPAGGAAN